MSFVKKNISLLTDSKYSEQIKWVIFTLNLVPVYIANYLRDHDFNGSSYAFIFSKRNNHALSHGNNLIKLIWYSIRKEVPNRDG